MDKRSSFLVCECTSNNLSKVLTDCLLAKFPVIHEKKTLLLWTVAEVRTIWTNRMHRTSCWFILYGYIKMHSQQNIKFVNAQQAKPVYRYENIKEKLYKTNAAVCYNKTCRPKQLTQNYISTNINGDNPQCRKTIQAAIHYRLNQDLKFLYVKWDCITRN